MPVIERMVSTARALAWQMSTKFQSPIARLVYYDQWGNTDFGEAFTLKGIRVDRKYDLERGNHDNGQDLNVKDW